MGILHSTTRFFGCNTEEDEEDERPFCLVFHFPRPRKTADAILPIQNPSISSIRSEPLLVQTPVVCSPYDDLSSYSTPEIGPTTFASVVNLNADEPQELQYDFAVVADFNTDEQKLQRDDVNGLSSDQRWPEENYSANRKQRDHNVIVPISDITCSIAYTTVSEEILRSAVFIEENAPKDVPVVEESMGMNSTEGEGEEENVVKIKSILVVSEERWIKHYSSGHRILLVGEGDFSFSASLAMAFGCASNMIATSLDSEEFLEKNYRRAESNIKELRRRDSKVMHEIDATKMANHALLGQRKFDRIIFNFPYAGLDTIKNLSRQTQLRRHTRLVSLFLENAREMISESGEIHISHKINAFHVEFKLEQIASSHELSLIEAVKFNHLDYPWYETKCGFGGDRYFNCNPSKTYKFGLKGFRY